MTWCKNKDILLCKEVLALQPYKHKKGSHEAGKIWTSIANSLKACKQLEFKKNLSQRGLRERFALIRTRFQDKEREE